MDGDSKVASFGINDESAWSLEGVKQALTRRYSSNVTVLEGPTPVSDVQ